MKSEQLNVVEMIAKTRDVFTVLPTSDGKSLCHGCLPIVFCKLLGITEEDRPVSTPTEVTTVHNSHRIRLDRLYLWPLYGCLSQGLSTWLLRKQYEMLAGVAKIIQRDEITFHRTKSAIGLQPDPRASRSWVWLRQTTTHGR